MEELVTLAQRLRWARLEQGVTLQQLSERSARAVSYLSQLEHGARLNPTRQTVEALALALGVSPAFLFGEVPRPPYDDRARLIISARAYTLGRLFRRHFSALPGGVRAGVALDGPQGRFCLVVRFLLEQLPEEYSPLEVAWQLGMSPGQLRSILAEGVEVSLAFLVQLAEVTGVPLRFLTHGELAEPAEPSPDGPPAPQATQAAARPLDMGRYFQVIRLAMDRALTPERLEQLIRSQPPEEESGH